MDRRKFLKSSAAVGASLLASGISRPALAASARIDAPAVNRVIVQEVTDGAHDIFLRPVEYPGLAVKRTGYNQVQGRMLHSEWGLALHLESQKSGETRRYLLDFGYTPDAYANNLDYMKIDPAAVDALIMSHGHYDHCGGLTGFLEAQRTKMRRPAPLYGWRGRLLSPDASRAGRHL